MQISISLIVASLAKASAHSHSSSCCMYALCDVAFIGPNVMSMVEAVWAVAQGTVGGEHERPSFPIWSPLYRWPSYLEGCSKERLNGPEWIGSSWCLWCTVMDACHKFILFSVGCQPSNCSMVHQMHLCRHDLTQPSSFFSSGTFAKVYLLERLMPELCVGCQRMPQASFQWLSCIRLSKIRGMCAGPRLWRCCPSDL